MFSLRYRRPPSAPQQPASPLYCDEHYDAKTKKPDPRPNYILKALASEYTLVSATTALALALRLWSITFPLSVISTELEMCNQINWYIAGKFFIGSYPPLAGLIYTALASSLGYAGDEQIYYAGQVPASFPLIKLRTASAVMGTLLVPLVYLTIRLLGHRRTAATTAAGLLMFENGLITQSRFVTPEGLLCLFCSLTALSWATQIRKQEREPFSIPYALQATTGILIGCTMSIKWQGGISLLVTWASTATYLWRILGEKRFALNYIAKQFMVRFATTAVLPLYVYFIIFQYHLGRVPNAGDHDLAVSARLRYSLVGNEFEQTQQDIAFGSSLVLRHLGTNGGYLHSHLRRYDGGSTQQEVSLYPFEDMNNIWVIHKSRVRWNESQPLEFVKNNDQVILEHFPTWRKLHSHDHRPPVSNKKEHNEVSAYGDPFISDANDYWWVQMLRDDDTFDGKDKTPLKAIKSRFRLLHKRGCHLLSHNVKLPNDEKPQQEVTCMTSAKKEMSSWVIESAYHPALTGEQTIGYEKLTRLEIMKEAHEHMLAYPSVIHDRLVPSTAVDFEKQLKALKRQQAKPIAWFLGTKAFRMWDQVAGRSIYLAMNPVVKAMTITTLCLCSIYLVLDSLLRKRQIKWPQVFKRKQPATDASATRELYYQSITYFCTASLIQALALYLMPAFNLKLADSLPSAYFSACLIAVVIDAVTSRMGKKAQSYACVAVLVFASYGFLKLSPISYGSQFWSQNDCKSMKGIDLECNRYPETLMHTTQSGNERQVISTVYVDMPGKVEPYRYHVGHEPQADEHIATMQRASFSKAFYEATGSLRYHKVESTPAPSETDIAFWQGEIYKNGEERVEQEKLEKAQKQEEERKSKMEKLKDEEQKQEA
ncbi:hypothetical protein BJV82DRAFT_395608 [Fennellomyces sp. T-0311]|nr:hypothetical protein BJV82DRAFT_395608 [Fennellomyces sp. T-0311]